MADDQRPRFSTPGIKEAAARETAKDLLKEGLIEANEIEDAAEAIAKNARQHADGYEIAKALDDREYWSCDFAMAEILDGHSRNVDIEIEQAEKAWASRVMPQPPFPIGTRVILARGETGEITDLYPHGAAKYCVKIDGDRSAEAPTLSRRIVNFEDVVELVPVSA